MATPEAKPTLHQFPFSHFNDKVRWALAYKGLTHHRRNYLPGPHARPLTKLSGQTSTPVLELDDRVVAGSAAILSTLEEVHPNPRLVPADPDQAGRALELQAHFDQHLGPAARTALFSVMMHEAGYVCRLFGKPQPLAKRALYRVVFPLARGKVAKAYGTDQQDFVDECIRTVDRSLDEISEATSATGFLVGDRFSVADLTAAALLGPIADPDHPEMARPKPVPASVIEFTARWRNHAAIEWARRMYAEHRPASKVVH